MSYARFRYLPGIAEIAAGVMLLIPVTATTPSWAQDTSPKAQPTRSDSPQTLQEVVPEIAWRSGQQGVLLLIAPDKIVRPPIDTSDFSLVRKYLETSLPQSDAGLPLDAVAQYFDCPLIPCGDVTTFSPRAMTVLNYKNLPPPSTTRAISSADSFHLLQTTLTRAQWQQLCSPQGVGLDDLTDREQRDLFLGALPPRITIRRYNDHEGEFIKVRDEQRRGIRLRLNREMHAAFILPGTQPWGGRNRLGLWYRTTGSQMKQQVEPEDSDSTVREQTRFGVRLAEPVPARPKLGQLPYDWDALAVAVPLDDVTTVGALVERIADVTRVEVYCDPRYARIPLYLRGDHARAGNLLKALARACGATYRRVGPAYVLTDDVDGLAARHAILYQWLRANQEMDRQVRQKFDTALRDIKPETIVTFAPGAPDPGAAILAAQIAHEAYLAQPISSNDPPRERDKLFKIGDFPAPARAFLEQQLVAARQGVYGEEGRQLIGDSVTVEFPFVLTWDIPGVGGVPAPYEAIVKAGNVSEEPEMRAKHEPVAVPQTVKTRALFVPNGEQTVLAPVLAEAGRAGFSEVWIEVEPDTLSPQISTLVASATRAGLAVRAVVRAGRVKPNTGRTGSIPISTSEGRDVNLLGETFTQYQKRLLATGLLPHLPWLDPAERPQTIPNPIEREMRRQQLRGDWWDWNSPEAMTNLVASVRRVSKIAGISGVVVSDLIPPGYFTGYSGQNDRLVPPESQGGYTEAMRLGFLRRYHADPIDISTVGRDRFEFLSGPTFRDWQTYDFTIPTFPSFGPESISYAPGEEDAPTLNAANALKLWKQFRARSAEAALDALPQKFRGSTVPIWFYRNDPTNLERFGAPYAVESRDKAPATPIDETKYDPFNPSDAQRARSGTLLIGYDLALLPRSDLFEFQPDAQSILFHLCHDDTVLKRNWNGFVIDLTGEPLPDILRQLSALPTPTATKPAKSR